MSTNPQQEAADLHAHDEWIDGDGENVVTTSGIWFAALAYERARVAKIGNEKFPTCESAGHCPNPTYDAAPFHHFYWDAERDSDRMEVIHGPEGKGHEDPESLYGAVVCKTCGFKALVLTENENEDFPEI